MPTTPTPRRRTIGCTEARSRAIANAGALLNITGEQFIQGAISAALLSLAQADPVFGYIVARSLGVDWQELERAAHSDVLAAVMA